MKKPGKLNIVATPIGNLKDITLRAIEILKTVDIVICEEYRRGSTLLKKLGISPNELVAVNEHNENEAILEILEFLLEGKTAALISDCGTPLFSDPGMLLVRACVDNQIQVVPVPGPSSLMAALSISPLPLKDFFFAGFLPQKSEQRLKKLESLKQNSTSIVLMDTPYRLSKSLAEVASVFGTRQLVTLAADLTKPAEAIFHGTIQDVIRESEQKKMEFILIIHR